MVTRLVFLGQGKSAASFIRKPKRLGIVIEFQWVPTVLRFEGLRVAVYPNDHRPVHVHVIGRGCEGVFNLNCPAGPVDLRENYRFSNRELNRIIDGVMAHVEELCRAWEHIHGIA